MNELVTIEKTNALELFTADNGIDPLLAELKLLVDSFHGDASTIKGQKEIISFCFKITKTKTYLERQGKEVSAELKAMPKLVDKERKRVKELLESWEAMCRKPLTDYEEKESIRIEKIKSVISWYSAHSEHQYLSQLTKESCKRVAAEFKAHEYDFEEFAEEAEKAKSNALLILRGRYAEIIEEEERQAEVDRVARKLAAEREKAIREEERAKAEKAEQEKIKEFARQKEMMAIAEKKLQESQEQARIDAIAAKKAAEARQIVAAKEAEEKRARDVAAAEARRIEQEKASEAARVQALKDAKAAAIKAAADAKLKAEKDAEYQLQLEKQEEARRAKDKAHKARIHNESFDFLMGLGLTENQAKSVVTAVAKNQVPHIKISY